MDVTARVSGPIFENPDLLGALVEAQTRVATMVGQRVRTNLSGGIVSRGPGRYGHLADQWRTAVIPTAGTVTARVFPSGKAAFRALWLEEGTRQHLILPRRRRRSRSGGSRRTRMLAIPIGGGVIFRPYALVRGTPATHFLERTLDETWPLARDIIAEASMRALNG